ncbi:hypothetical protein KR038_000111, partial [Drosophila bunnanda]
MAPKKRISRIPTRAVAPLPEAIDGTSRSIGIQTDPEPSPQCGPQPTKRQKILEKIKQLRKAKKSDEATTDMDTSEATSSAATSSAAASSSSLPLKSVAQSGKSFEPGPNEKACQVKESELGPIRERPKSDFAIKMEFLKSEVDRRRVESIMWDINRLDVLDEMINHDPPPRWSAACDMWMEVDQLEARIEAFAKEEEQ